MNRDGNKNGVQASINVLDDVESVAKKWRELEEKASPSFFVCWDWIETWLRLVRPHTQVYLFESVENGEVVGLCFLTLVNVKRGKGFLSSRQVQLNEFRHSNFDMTSQYNGILCKEENLEKVYSSFLTTLKTELMGWDEILCCSMPQNHFYALKQSMDGELNWAQEENHMIWKVPLSPSCADEQTILSNMKRKSRQQLKQSFKAIRKEWGEIRIQKAQSLETGLQYFEEMAVIHTQRWRRVGEKGVFLDSNWSGFHRDLIQKTFAQNKILLFKIDTDSGRLLGYLYGFLHNGEALMQQTGFVQSEHNAIRPGYVSHLVCMMHCAANGIKSYDFLPDPAISYKKFFCTSADNVVRGRVQKNKLKFKLENKVKRIVKKEINA